MKEAVVPGLSIAVIKDSKLLWRRAFGLKDSATQEPVDDDTVFEAASVSKTVFAYVVMKLCEKGTLGLDTPLAKYAPKPFLEGDPRLGLITARHVLSHTSGFQNFRSRENPLRIHFTPGERYLYSGEGYFYLQSVISHFTGRVDPKTCARYEADLEVCATDIGQYLKANLLVPFGMTSSTYLWDENLERHSATPHDAEGKPITKGRGRETDLARYAAAGGLRTTPSDYAKFLIEVISPKPSDAHRLTMAGMRQMVRAQVKVDPATSWALGWQIQHRRDGDRIQHQGGQRGVQAFTSASVERNFGYVIMTNSDNGWKVFYNKGFNELMDRLLTTEA